MQEQKLKGELDDSFVMEVIKKVEEYAADLSQTAAGYNDIDPEAEKLKEALFYYRLGLKKEVPLAWAEFQRQVVKERDPEYPEFLRLQEKFGE